MMVQSRGDSAIDTRETPFLVQLIAWANVATGLLLLIRFAYFSSLHEGHVPILAVGLVELVVGVPLAFGQRWAYLVTLVLQPLNFAASIGLLISTHDSAPLLPVLFYAATTFVLLAPLRWTGTMGATVRLWSADHAIKRTAEGSEPA